MLSSSFPGVSPREKFRRSGGGPLPVFQPFHVHLHFAAPAGAGNVPQSSRHQQCGRVSVGEGAHHAGPAPDLPVDALQGIGGADLEPVLPGKRHVGQGLARCGGSPQMKQLPTVTAVVIRPFGFIHHKVGSATGTFGILVQGG